MEAGGGPGGATHPRGGGGVPGPGGRSHTSDRRALAAPGRAQCGARAEMGSPREEEEDEEEESRSERRPAGLGPAVGLRAALEVTPQGSAPTPRPGLGAPASSACRRPAAPPGSPPLRS